MRFTVRSLTQGPARVTAAPVGGRIVANALSGRAIQRLMPLLEGSCSVAGRSRTSDAPIGCYSMRPRPRRALRGGVRSRSLEMQFQVVGTVLAVSCLAIGCGRGGDPRSVPPLPPAPGEISTLRDTWEYAECAKAMRSAREQYVADCSQTRPKQECRELAAERYKDQRAFCESLVLR